MMKTIISRLDGKERIVDDEQELFDTIKRVIMLDITSRRTIGQNAHNLVVEKYSLQAHVDSLFKLYHSKP